MAIPENVTQVLKEARQRLAKANDLEQIKRIWVEARTIRLEARVAADPKLLRLAGELRLLAERKLGKLLAAMKLRGGDHRSSQFAEAGEPRLQALGVSVQQSARWQRAASVPNDRFRQYLRDAANQIHGATSHGLQRIAEALQACNGIEPFAVLGNTLRSLARQGKTFACIYADLPDEAQITQYVKSLASLPVQRVAAPNAHLYLWIIPAGLAEGLRVFNAWGFRYASLRVWAAKPVKGDRPWLLPHRCLLLGIRGRIPFPDNCFENVVSGRRSSKPDECRRLLEQVSPGPRLDLFGTKAVAGWTLAMSGRANCS